MRPPEEERAWEVVRRAYEERTPQPRATHGSRVLIAGARRRSRPRSPPPCSRRPAGPSSSACARRSASSTPSRRSSRCRRPGRLLVVSTDGGGVWLVRANGFKRRLGPYADAQWSPHGLFVVATTRNAARSRSTRTATCAGRSRARDVALPRWAGHADRHAHRLPRARAACASSRGDGTRRPAARRDRDARRRRRGIPGGLRTSRTSRAAARSCCATRTRARVRWRRQADRRPLCARMVGRRAAPRRRVGDAHRRARRRRPARARRSRSLGATLVDVGVPSRATHQLAVSVRLAGAERGEARRRRPSGSRAPALRRPGHVRRRRLVARRRDGCSSTGRRRTSGSSCAARTRARGREHPRAVPARVTTLGRRSCSSAGRWCPLASGACSRPVTASPTRRSSSGRTSR